MRDLKAVLLLKHNIDELLKARHQKRKELARYCRRSEAWLSQIFIDENRNVPLKYLDRIADFFGIATYQLLQPGISPLTERRAGTQRRSGRDRRLSAAIPISTRPGDVDLMDVIRALSRESREKAVRILGDILNDDLRSWRTTAPTVDERHRTGETRPAMTAQARGRKKTQT